MNLTDIDDKIIRGAAAEGITHARARGPLRRPVPRRRGRAGHDPPGRPAARHRAHRRRSRRWSRRCSTRATPTATDDGSIFFRIASWPAYGRLARLDPDAMRVGERVEADEYGKDDVRDFALWKGPKPGEPSWDTAIGPGPARLAHRVLRDEHGPPRAVVRHPHGRRGPRLPAPRGRDRPVRGGDRPAVRADLAALRAPADGRREDGEVDGEHRPRGGPGRRRASRRARCATR